MGIYIYGIRSQQQEFALDVVPARGAYIAKKLPVRFATYIQRWEDNFGYNRMSDRDRGRYDANMSRAETIYRKTGKAYYTMLIHDAKKPSESFFGNTVYQVSDYCNGVFDDARQMESQLTPIGTILGKPRQWHICTDLETVEMKRRDMEVKQMKAGARFIGGCGSDWKAWLDELAAKDQEAGHLITRGHGI